MAVSRKMHSTDHAADAPPNERQHLGKDHAEGVNGGPTQGDGYDTKYAASAQVIRSLGGTDDNLGFAFGVPVTTINQWQSNHGDFAEACQAGSELANAKLRQSLFKRATGYEYSAQKVIAGKRPRIVEYQVHVPANVDAIKYCLTNLEEFKKFTYKEVEKQVLTDMARQLARTARRPVELPPPGANRSELADERAPPPRPISNDQSAA